MYEISKPVVHEMEARIEKRYWTGQIIKLKINKDSP